MATRITLTGTGHPLPSRDRAGAGLLVEAGGLKLQFDAGRGTVMRLAGAGVNPQQLDAVFLTHHHSDHLTGLSDVVLTRWTPPGGDRLKSLPIVCPRGPSSRFADQMMSLWHDDIETRNRHTHRSGSPRTETIAFDAPRRPELVWQQGDVKVWSSCVRHHGVEPSVGYRIETPDGVVAFSGDTVVCDEVAALAADADVLVHESMRRHVLKKAVPAVPVLEHLMAYHADSIELGALAERIRVPKLVLTHLIPEPLTPEHEAGFADDACNGGFDGELVVGRDLTTLEL